MCPGIIFATLGSQCVCFVHLPKLRVQCCVVVRYNGPVEREFAFFREAQSAGRRLTCRATDPPRGPHEGFTTAPCSMALLRPSFVYPAHKFSWRDALTIEIDRDTYSHTVLMGSKKAILLKIYYFHVLTSLLGQKFHTVSKTSIKKSHTLMEGSTF